MPQWLSDLLWEYGPKILTAAVILVVGLWLSGIAAKISARAMKKSRLDPSVHTFLRSAISIGLKILVIVSVLGTLGVSIATIIAAISAAGVAIALALQGSLANIASGLLVLLFHPFKVGDFIEAQNHSGTVVEIQLMFTILHTPDNRRVIIPNSQMTGSSIVNVTAEPKRRLDQTYCIGYDDDIGKAKAVLDRVIRANPLCVLEPEPVIAVSAQLDSSIQLVVKVWVETPNYWDLYYELQEQVKLAFDQEGISIPFNQLDVHVSRDEVKSE
ncbi:MAG: mechanosensitive ion channel [Clostridiales bacterium]|nr:mechanosensitive ion channel [Clostridiales bacterium]